MGFRTGAYAKVWQVTPKSDKITDLKVSVSKKRANEDKYDVEFTGFVSAIGTAAASKAAKLKEGDRIQLGDIDVTRVWDAEAKREYTNFKIFTFNTAEEGNINAGSSGTASAKPKKPEPDEAYEGMSGDLPF